MARQRLSGVNIMLRLIVCLGWIFSASAWADLTIEGHNTQVEYDRNDRFRMYLRQEQMRVDRLTDEKINGPGEVLSTTLIRFNGEPAGVIHLDHGAKTARVVATIEAGSHDEALTGTARVVKRDETRNISGHKAQAYDFSFVHEIDALALLGPLMPPGMGGLLTLQLNVRGTSWVVPGQAGVGELVVFLNKLSQRHLVIPDLDGTPQPGGGTGTMAASGLAYGIAGVFAEIAGKGFPFLTTTHSVIEPGLDGAMGMMMQEALNGMGIGGRRTAETTVTGVATTPVDAALFYGGLLPEGYTLN